MLSAAELRGRAKQCVSVTHCDPCLLGGAVGSVHASTVPAACSDKSIPAVRGRAHPTRLGLHSQPLCSTSAVLVLSALFTGEELWAKVVHLSREMMCRASTGTQKHMYAPLDIIWYTVTVMVKAFTPL